MAWNRHDRIYDKRIKGIIRGSKRRDKGKKKRRRIIRAGKQDGWERKRAGGLRPQTQTSKQIMREENKWEV